MISAGDMTFEACAVKLGWLFGRGLGAAEVAKEFKRNLRGELSPVLKREARFEGDTFVVRPAVLPPARKL